MCSTMPQQLLRPMSHNALQTHQVSEPYFVQLQCLETRGLLPDELCLIATHVHDGQSLQL